MKAFQIFILTIFLGVTASAREYHVAKTGSDQNAGTTSAPLLTIQAAADRAQPGDIITVHAGVYRERITPPRGGMSDSQRITYRAADGEKAVIKGSEVIDNWEHFVGDVWKVTIPNAFFGDYNPYKDIIRGDWFNDHGRVHHTGAVYLNGKSLWEMEILEKVLDPQPQKGAFDSRGSTFTWFCESDEANTYIYANFQGADPNEALTEINVRRSCFYPDTTGISFITIRGFHLSQAATQWAPPTAEQIGLIGTNWSKGWIIEENRISDSRCSGITLGKHGDQYDNTSQNSAEGYVETIYRALERGWSKENIGSHVIRNNEIFHCEQTGICGSMGGVFSIIENNDIHDIWTKRQFSGAEMGGVKIHASIDMQIRNNRFARCGRGLWLDWMAQGTRVTGNLFYNNTTDDIFVEVNHGPFLIENNILLSDVAIRDWSEGGAFVHNLVAGNIQLVPQGRLTPYHPPHSTEVAGLKNIEGGDDRYINNIFIGGVRESGNLKAGLAVYENAKLPVMVKNNVYLNGASAFSKEENPLVLKSDPEVQIEEKPGGVFLSLKAEKAVLKMKNPLVTTELLGKAIVTGQAYTRPDGSALKIGKDFFGKKRRSKNPVPGPFEELEKGDNRMKVWN